MKKVIMLLMMASIIFSCDNAATEAENENTELEADRADRNEYNGLAKEGDDYYVFTGTAPEQKNAFDKAASDLEADIKKLKNSTTDNDVVEKLDEVQEKINEAREKSKKADEKIVQNKLDDAEEAIDDAREKLEEAREKYLEALEKINNVE